MLSRARVFNSEMRGNVLAHKQVQCIPCKDPVRTSIHRSCNQCVECLLHVTLPNIASHYKRIMFWLLQMTTELNRMRIPPLQGNQLRNASFVELNIIKIYISNHIKVMRISNFNNLYRLQGTKKVVITDKISRSNFQIPMLEQLFIIFS